MLYFSQASSSGAAEPVAPKADELNGFVDIPIKSSAEDNNKEANPKRISNAESFHKELARISAASPVKRPLRQRLRCGFMEMVRLLLFAAFCLLRYIALVFVSDNV